MHGLWMNPSFNKPATLNSWWVLYLSKLTIGIPLSNLKPSFDTDYDLLVDPDLLVDADLFDNFSYCCWFYWMFSSCLISSNLISLFVSLVYKYYESIYPGSGIIQLFSLNNCSYLSLFCANQKYFLIKPKIVYFIENRSQSLTSCLTRLVSIQDVVAAITNEGTWVTCSPSTRDQGTSTLGLVRTSIPGHILWRGAHWHQATM